MSKRDMMEMVEMEGATDEDGAGVGDEVLLLLLSTGRRTDHYERVEGDVGAG
jgi:microcompartment protein CcmK/EutM